jgi:hypothetical protein
MPSAIFAKSLPEHTFPRQVLSPSYGSEFASSPQAFHRPGKGVLTRACPVICNYASRAPFARIDRSQAAKSTAHVRPAAHLAVRATARGPHEFKAAIEPHSAVLNLPFPISRCIYAVRERQAIRLILHRYCVHLGNESA